MINYTSINSILPMISKNVRKEDTTSQLLSYILRGYRQLSMPSETKEEVVVIQIKDHKAVLPEGIKNITLATYMGNTPTDSEQESINSIETVTITIDTSVPDATNECVGNYILGHKLFLLSDYFNNNFMPMKYIGNSSFVCTDCLNRFCHECNETFSVDENKVMYTSFKDGYVCLIYDIEVKLGNQFAIVDDPDVKEYLVYFATLKHFEDRFYTGDEVANRVTPQLKLDTATSFKRARGSMLQKMINKNIINDITVNDPNARFLKHGAFAYKNN